MRLGGNKQRIALARLALAEGRTVPVAEIKVDTTLTFGSAVAQWHDRRRFSHSPQNRLCPAPTGDGQNMMWSRGGSNP